MMFTKKVPNWRDIKAQINGDRGERQNGIQDREEKRKDVKHHNANMQQASEVRY